MKLIGIIGGIPMFRPDLPGEDDAINAMGAQHPHLVGSFIVSVAALAVGIPAYILWLGFSL